MPRRFAKAFTFALERWIQRGIAHQLLLMTALVALVAILGGLSAWITTTRFPTLSAAIWWAFLRLTDPGYLGDDEGYVLRLISTIVTVLGYVLFMGSLIAIMTQWLSRTMRTLESGLTPISMRDHVVILGWTNRTPEIVAKLLGAKGRLDRFLEERKTRRLRVVILADEVDTARRIELLDYLGDTPQSKQIFLRSGSSLHPEHLERLDLARAAVVVIPGSDFELGGTELTDSRVVKTLLTMRRIFRHVPKEQQPHVVAEIFDSEMHSVAVGATGNRVEVVTTDRVISRLVSQSIRHRGMAEILFSLLTHREGNSLYVRGFPELAGHTLRALAPAFPESVVLGFIRTTPDGPLTVFDPGSNTPLQAADQLVLLAETYAQCTYAGIDRINPSAHPDHAPLPTQKGQLDQSVLVLGWSPKVTRLISELDQSRSGQFAITIMSRIKMDDRTTELDRAAYSQERIRIDHVCADYGVERDLLAVDPARFDHVLFVASGSMHSAEEADARTVLGYELLRRMLRHSQNPPEVLVELLDPANAHLFDADDAGLVLVSPQVLSHVLAHVALRPELNAVFDALFCSGGAEFEARPVAEFGLSGQTVSFAEIQQAASRRSVVALGVMARNGNQPTLLNPERTQKWTLTGGDQIIVLATTELIPADS